ncbi:hypothetical protein HXX02_09005 [Microbulbifer elongatus]|uniref:DNA breaking-rejoining protein n=1 Tax=Microbulbifer elongatus TaxID=86173 RepID=A0ABT1P0D1_9GAMM|nr:DUF4832 domain-containing protein [Microbulbifer elongatus]MCQ3829586.1 hypothetical protein [Microbulbifer elongatus]
MQPTYTAFQKRLRPGTARVLTCLLIVSPPPLVQAQEGQASSPVHQTVEAPRSSAKKIQLHKRANSPFESAGVKGSVTGENAIEYLIEAKTGQSLELDLRSDHALAGYRITAPAAPRALHHGQGRHSVYSGTLPRDGTYRVLVYLLDAAAKNGDRAEFFLNIRIRNPG